MAVEKTIASTSLAEVVDRILDKDIVIDAWVRVSLVGIELLAIEARAVVAGVDFWDATSHGFSNLPRPWAVALACPAKRGEATG